MSKVVQENDNWVDLSELPRYVKGAYKDKINWSECIGRIVQFHYKDIDGVITIINYIKEKQYLSLLYNDTTYSLKTQDLVNCRVGGLLNLYSKEFKVDVGTIINNDKLNLTIIGREYRIEEYSNQKYNKKYYNYSCNVCGYKGWVEEHNLMKKSYGCSCCSGKKAVLGINTIWDKNKWMIPYVGEEFAKTHTSSCSDKINLTCPDCGAIKKNKVSINNLFTYKKISCVCNDNFSYPNKFSYNLLDQLNKSYRLENLQHEYSPKWIGLKRYDNYFEFENKIYILEMDGGLGHGNGIHGSSNVTIEESILSDKYKDEMALKNDITVIRIDCNKSNFEDIKINIENSILSNIFDLNKVNWLECGEFALKNICKHICEIKRDNDSMSTVDIANELNISPDTVREYLVKGSKVWDWINYDAKMESHKGSAKGGILHGKRVEIFKDDISLGVFPSCSELEKQSEKLFGVKLGFSMIASVCRGERKQYKGFTFKYI